VCADNQERRFAKAGAEGLLREATRRPGRAPLGGQPIRWVVGTAAQRGYRVSRSADGADTWAFPRVRCSASGGEALLRFPVCQLPNTELASVGRIRQASNSPGRPVRPSTVAI
jgi:hypothetical protein